MRPHSARSLFDDRAPRALAALALLLAVYLLLRTIGLDPVPSLASRLAGSGGPVVVAAKPESRTAASFRLRVAPLRELERQKHAPVAARAARTGRGSANRAVPVRTIAQPRPGARERDTAPTPEPQHPTEKTAEPEAKPTQTEPAPPADSAAPDPAAIVPPPPALPTPPTVPLPDPTTLVDPGVVPPAPPVPDLPALP